MGRKIKKLKLVTKVKGRIRLQCGYATILHSNDDTRVRILFCDDRIRREVIVNISKHWVRKLIQDCNL